MAHRPFGCFKTFKEYQNQPEIDESIQEGEELKDYPDDPHDYSQDYEHDPMDCYHQIEDLLIETREILNRIEARQ